MKQKSISILLAMLMSMAANVVLANTIMLNITKQAGEISLGSLTYGSEYASTDYSTVETIPGVRIQHWHSDGSHRNMMYFYDDNNLGFYSQGLTAANEDSPTTYRIYPSHGYYITNISFDFIPGKHPNFAMNGVRVWLGKQENQAVTSPDVDHPGHISMNFTTDDFSHEIAYAVLNVGQVAENGNPIFAHLYNFRVTLEERNPLDVAIDDLLYLMDSYETFTAEGSKHFIGDGKPGNYNADAVATFNEVYQKCLQRSQALESAEQVKELIAELEAAYEAVIASRVTQITLVDGYYRFRAGMNYNAGIMYMYATNNNGSITGNWGTKGSFANDCQSLFQVKNVGEGVYDITSMSTDARFNDNPSTLSYESENLYVFEPVVTLHGVTYVDIRRNDMDTGRLGYIHQAGHASGSGTGGNLTTWYSTYMSSTSNRIGASEWVIEAVDESTALTIIEAYAPTKERNRLLYECMILVQDGYKLMEDVRYISAYNKLGDLAIKLDSLLSNFSELDYSQMGYDELLSAYRELRSSYEACRTAAYNYIESANVMVEADGASAFVICLNNEATNLVAFQMDLTLPEGIGIEKAGCSLSSRITDEKQELKIGKLENGAYRLTSSSLSLTPISGQDGTLLTLVLTAESGSIGGQATISNIIFSTSDSEKIIMSDETFDVNVLYKVVYKVENEIYQTDEFAYNTQPTIADEPTREGYTFGGWSELPKLMPNHDVEITGRFYLFGDVNTDEGVDVVDVVDIARFVVATPSTQFREKLADLNNDNTVNLGDAVVLINHIAGDQNFVKARFAPAWSVERNDVLSLTQSSNTLALNLSNGRDYTAFQFDLYVSNDAIVNQMMLSAERGQGHQLLYNKLETGHYRVAVLSMSNSTFQGNEGELLSFTAEGTPFAEASIRNILFFDTHANGYAFDDMSIDMATGLHDVNINGNKDDVIYDLQGRKLPIVQRGVNIINGKKVVVKR